MKKREADKYLIGGAWPHCSKRAMREREEFKMAPGFLVMTRVETNEGVGLG